jgi:FTR1 family protein
MIAFVLSVALLATHAGPPALPQASSSVVASVPAAQADFVTRIDGVLAELQPITTSGGTPEARESLLRVYLDRYEAFEGLFGQGSGQPAALVSRVMAGEEAFHLALRSRPEDFAASVRELIARMNAVRSLAADVTIPHASGELLSIHGSNATARTPEIRAVLQHLSVAEANFNARNNPAALSEVEHAYLESFEPIESRLPAGRVNRIEKLFHLSLRPELARGSDRALVTQSFASLRSELLDADQMLSAGTTFWFGAANAFAILMREGLEAVLLVAALLAYLAAADPSRKYRRQIYFGVLAGCVATLATWFVARLIIPIGGASRELVEGITGLIAVCVLLYVSNWLFQKTYIHDWKDYLKKHVGAAIGSGSAFAMASLAFAAIYREGFETVLFYQALLFDSGTTAVLAGFLPALALVLLIGFGIIQLGVKLPLKKMFSVTNAILIYLAFVLVGKCLYNLQEAGIFAPHPIHWIPDYEALRQVLGVYPLVETTVAQLAFVCLVTSTFIFYKVRLAHARLAAAAVPVA